MALSWFRNFILQQGKAKKAKVNELRKWPRCKPVLEMLEERRLMSVTSIYNYGANLTEGYTAGNYVGSFYENNPSDTYQITGSFSNVSAAYSISGAYYSEWSGSYYHDVYASTSAPAEEGYFTSNFTVTDVTTNTSMTSNTQTNYAYDASINFYNVQAVTEGQAINNQYIGSFVDYDPNANIADYSAYIGWGDGQYSSTSNGTISIVQQGTSQYFDVYATKANPFVDDNFTNYLQVTDGGGASASSYNNVQEAYPLSASANTLNTLEGTILRKQVVASFTDANTLASASDFRADITWGDGSSTSFDAGTISIVNTGPGTFNVVATQTTPYAEEGAYNVGVSIRETGGYNINSTFTNSTVNVAEANFTATGAPTVFGSEGVPLGSQKVASFTDTNSPDVATDFSATVNWGDGDSTASYTIVNGSAPGSYDVYATKSNPYTEDDPQNITVTIFETATPSAVATATTSVQLADPDLAATAATVTAVEGQLPTNQVVATFADGNTNDAASDFSATINWGNGETSAGTVTLTNGQLQVLGAKPTPYGEEGPYSFTVTITDAEGNSTSTVSTASVTDAGLTSTGGTIAATEGAAPATFTVATFTDLGGSENVSDYSAIIDWGDGGSSLDIGTISKDSSRNLSVLGTHSFAEEGVHTVTVFISHETNPATTATLRTDVANAPLSVSGQTIRATEGQAVVNQVVATFTDANSVPDINDYSASVAWGDDDTSSSVSIISLGSGVFEVVASKTNPYAEQGIYGVNVTVFDLHNGQNGAGDANQGTGSARVIDAPLTATSGQPLWAIEGAVPSPNMLVGTFTDGANNPSDVASDYTATIAWGDGETGAGVVSLVNGQFQVQGTKTLAYAEEGVQNVVVKIVDKDGRAFTNATTSLTVYDANLTAAGITIPMTEGDPIRNVLVGTFTDANPKATVDDFSVTVLWDDGASTPNAFVQRDAVNSSIFDVYASKVGSFDEGLHHLTITVSDVGAASTVIHSDFNVADAALNAVGVVIPATEGAPVTGVLVATFTDKGGLESTTDYSAIVTWEDGSTSQGTIQVDPNTASQYDVIADRPFFSPSFAEEGNQLVVVSILDNDGGSSANATSVAPVEDAPLSATAGPHTFNVTEGRAYSGVVATFTDADSHDVASDYSALIFWGDHKSSVGILTPVEGSGTGQTFQVRSADLFYPEDGDYPVTVQITDLVGGKSTSVTNTAHVLGQLHVTPNSSLASTEGLPVGSESAPVLVGTFTDENPNPDISDFSATINWGDSTSSVGTVTALGSGVFGVLASKPSPYLEEGIHYITVTALDTGVAYSASTSIYVDDAPLTTSGQTVVPAIEGQAVNDVVVATFTDANPGGDISDFSASVDWGDGSSITSGRFVQLSTGQFEVLATKATPYAEEGSHIVTVSINDHGSSVLVTNTLASIIDAPIHAVATTINATERQPVNGLVATFTDEGGNELASDYSAVVNWGDGDTSAGVISLVSGQLEVLATKPTPYADEGTKAITVTITDNVASDTAHSTAIITEADGIVTGTVFKDLNSNGQQNTGEPGLAGQTVFADYAVSGIYDGVQEGTEPTAVTDANGNYTMEVDPSKTFVVRLLTPDNTVQRSLDSVLTDYHGTLQTSPLSDTPLTVSPNTTAPGGNFGVIQVSAIPPAHVASNLYDRSGISNFPTGHPDAKDAYVEGLYHNILGRGAESYAALKGWVDQIAVIGFDGVASRIWESQEHRVYEVQSYYQTFLDRAEGGNGTHLGDEGKNWVDMLMAGKSEVDVIQNFMNSPEFLNSLEVLPNPPVDKFIDEVYRDLLGRPADQAGAANWKDQITNHGLSLAQFARDISTSTEAYSRAVSGFYQEFLHRDGSKVDIAGWVSQLSAGMTLEQVAVAIMSSPEYRTNAANSIA